jgi:hypothetical protein
MNFQEVSGQVFGVMVRVLQTGVLNFTLVNQIYATRAPAQVHVKLHLSCSFP